MIEMSSIERQKLNERLSAVVDNHKPELNKGLMDQCGFKLINDDKDTSRLTLVTKESSDSVFSFMYKIFGADPFLSK